MNVFLDLFPVVAFFIVGALVVVTIRAKGKLAGGSENAGPLLPPTQVVPGLSAESIDARSVSRLLKYDPNQVVGMLRELATNEGLDAGGRSPDPLAEVNVLVARLEQHLDLPPFLTEAGHGHGNQ